MPRAERLSFSYGSQARSRHSLARCGRVHLRRGVRAVDVLRRARSVAEADPDRVARAIFLSTFVMIGQNRQASFQQATADRDFVAQEKGASVEHRTDPVDPSAHDRNPPPGRDGFWSLPCVTSGQSRWLPNLRCHHPRPGSIATYEPPVAAITRHGGPSGSIRSQEESLLPAWRVRARNDDEPIRGIARTMREPGAWGCRPTVTQGVFGHLPVGLVA
jgi:hypothetical protein